MKSILLILVALFCVTASFGQKALLGFNTKFYDPTEGFSNNVGHTTPIGLSVMYLKPLNKSKLSIGSELGVAMYSSNKYKIDYKGKDIRIVEEDCFWTLHGMVRYDMVRTSKLVTYMEFRTGMTTFFSNKAAVNENSSYQGHFKFHGTAFNNGLGGGLMFLLAGNQEDATGMWVNIGANFYSGSRTHYRYMPERDATVSLKEGRYESLTDYMGYRLGFLWQL